MGLPWSALRGVGMQVRGTVPVAEGIRVHARGYQGVDLGSRLRARVGALGGQDEAPWSAEAGDEALVRRDGREDLAEGPVHRAIEEQLVDLGHAGLHGHDPVVRQPIADQGVELGGEEQARRALFERLGQVHHDQVETLLGLLEVGAGVLMQHPGARVLEGALVHLGQVLLALLDHLTVDIHHQAVGDGGVPQDFPDRRALAASDDHGPCSTR